MLAGGVEHKSVQDSKAIKSRDADAAEKILHLMVKTDEYKKQTLTLRTLKQIMQMKYV